MFAPPASILDALLKFSQYFVCGKPCTKYAVEPKCIPKNRYGVQIPKTATKSPNEYIANVQEATKHQSKCVLIECVVRGFARPRMEYEKDLRT